MRDTTRAKPETFTMDAVDAWFSINLIEALLDMDDIAPPARDSLTLDDIVDEAPDDDDAGLFIAGASRFAVDRRASRLRVSDGPASHWRRRSPSTPTRRRMPCPV